MGKKLGYNIRIKGEVNPQTVREYFDLAKRADNAGIYYLGVPGFFDRSDRRILHLFTYVSALAVVTEHAKVGFECLLIPLIHPKHVADIGASLDIISNGRFVLGAGLGWRRDEYEKFEVPWEERGKRLDESLDIIKKLWTQPMIDEYNGKFFKFKNVCSPPCVQKPHPPIWVGGESNAALRRVAQYGNEWTRIDWWVPEMGIPEEKWNVNERLEKLKEYCKQFGRELVLGREPKDQKEVGFNQRIHVNISSSKEKAVENARYFRKEFREVQGKQTTGGSSSFESKMKYAAIGNAEEVIEKIKKVYDTGAYLVTLYPLSTDSKTQWERIEKEVLPSL